MKLALSTLFLVGCSATATQSDSASLAQPAPQDAQMPTPTEPDANHEWLARLVGEWRTDYVCPTGPDSEPMRMEGTQTVHSVGDLWFVSEGVVEMGGESSTNRLTLGYDTRKEAFVGTWIDSLFTHLWIYTGSLDAEREVLTLETEGPDMNDPSRDASYRETLEFEGPDRYVFTSSVQGADGEWTVLVRAESRRKK